MLAFYLVVPFMEQIFFRIGIQHLLFRNMRTIGIIVTTNLYGLYGLLVVNNLIMFVIYAMLGFVYAYAYDKTESIATPMVLHFMSNILGLTLTGLVG